MLRTADGVRMADYFNGSDAIGGGVGYLTWIPPPCRQATRRVYMPEREP